MTVNDLLRNHDKDDHIRIIYIYQHDVDNCIYRSQDFKLPKHLRERDIVKWAIEESYDAWIYLNIEVK